MQKNIRQLAAIMFTDMVGYTALMQEDEDQAIQNRQRHRDVLRNSIEKHHGLILQFYGDGTLSVFGSAIEAIECAVEIQQELQKDPVIPVRIGMHVGDIAYSDDGIYGDAVNVASRIENLSVPGGVLISDKVYDEIKNHRNFPAISLGKFNLKNVKRPIELFALTNDGLQLPEEKTKTGQDKRPATLESTGQEYPILQTKLYVPPPRHDLVHRQNLLSKLNHGLSCKLILVSAPAGFGKTTLVSEWISQLDQQVCWLSLDEDLSDYTRFMAYLIAALRKVDQGIGETVMSMLKSTQPASTDTILTILLNELATIPEDSLLILDDYHLVDNKDIDNTLQFLIEHLPPQLHIVIASREDPPLPLARLRVRRQMVELRASDLRFSSLEAVEFLNQTMNLNLSAGEIDALENRTEGWIAGLQLAALSMQGHQDTAGFIKSFTGSHHYILDYLLEEVLHRQPDHIQKFMLHTSIFDRICGSLSDAVLDNPPTPSQEILESMVQSNLFIIPLDSERRWYRYHHLFGDLLKQNLHQESDSADSAHRVNIPELHLRGSMWFEKHGFTREAFHHAVEGRDLHRAAHLAELAWSLMDSTFQSSTWLTWIKQIPEEYIRARPVLSAGYAWALLDTGEMEKAEKWLAEAEKQLDLIDETGIMPEGLYVSDEQIFKSIPAIIATARAYHAQSHGDVNATLEYARHALELMPESDSRRGPIAGLMGCSYWARGDLDKSYNAFSECVQILLKNDGLLPALSTTIGLGGVRLAQGRLLDAKAEYEKSLRMALEQEGQLKPVTSDMYLGLGIVHWELGDLEMAGQNLAKSRETGEQAALPDWNCRCHLAQSRFLTTRGELNKALDHLEEAERLYFRTPLPDIHPIPALRARIYIRQGKLNLAENWADTLELSVDDDLCYIREFEYLTLARLLITVNGKDQHPGPLAGTMKLLNRMLKAAEDDGRTGSTVEILILLALASQQSGDRSEALKFLERSLLLAEPEGFVRIFVDEGAHLLPLIEKTDTSHVSQKYLQKLLRSVKESGSSEQGSNQNKYGPLLHPPSESLSKRELEVLQLISQGLSNTEISEKLFLALSTVKGHNLKIFDKLNVQRRTEAVAKARELGLI